jgi:uncharacterized protein YbcC (UPF0753/DUF2309 family)
MNKKTKKILVRRTIRETITLIQSEQIDLFPKNCQSEQKFGFTADEPLQFSANQGRVVNLTEDLTDVDFIADSEK